MRNTLQLIIGVFLLSGACGEGKDSRKSKRGPSTTRDTNKATPNKALDRTSGSQVASILCLEAVPYAGSQMGGHPLTHLAADGDWIGSVPGGGRLLAERDAETAYLVLGPQHTVGWIEKSLVRESDCPTTCDVEHPSSGVTVTTCPRSDGLRSRSTCERPDGLHPVTCSFSIEK